MCATRFAEWRVSARSRVQPEPRRPGQNNRAGALRAGENDGGPRTNFPLEVPLIFVSSACRGSDSIKSSSWGWRCCASRTPSASNDVETEYAEPGVDAARRSARQRYNPSSNTRKAGSWLAHSGFSVGNREANRRLWPGDFLPPPRDSATNRRRRERSRKGSNSKYPTDLLAEVSSAQIPFRRSRRSGQ